MESQRCALGAITVENLTIILAELGGIALLFGFTCFFQARRKDFFYKSRETSEAAEKTIWFRKIEGTCRGIIPKWSAIWKKCSRHFNLH
jgi:hypothetical protein